MTSYLNSVDPFSLSRIVFEIFDVKHFWVRLWPLNFRGQLRSKIVLSFKIPNTTSYLISIDTIFISYWFWDIWLQNCYGSILTFDLKRSYEVITIQKPMPDFLSNSYWQFSRYLTSNILGLDLDLWSQKKSSELKNVYIIQKSHSYMISYSTSLDTISLPRTVLEIMPVKISKAALNGGIWHLSFQNSVVWNHAPQNRFSR